MEHKGTVPPVSGEEGETPSPVSGAQGTVPPVSGEEGETPSPVSGAQGTVPPVSGAQGETPPPVSGAVEHPLLLVEQPSPVRRNTSSVSGAQGPPEEPPVSGAQGPRTSC